jgi:succinate dehydrogenase/fumarate reductase-like Fe-S protein
VLSRCISCASCVEACPQCTPVNHFVGAAVFSRVKLFNIHPTGKALKDERLEVMMAECGIGDCSKAGNCVVVRAQGDLQPGIDCDDWGAGHGGSSQAIPGRIAGGQEA